MDAAFYTEENLSDFKYSIKWLSRVPLTIKASLELTQTLVPEQFTKSTMYEGYQFCCVCNEYTGIKQLWIVVESDERKEADLKALLKRIDNSLAGNRKSLKTLESKEFACEADALRAAADFEKTLKYHLLSELKVVSKPHYQRRGRPRPGDEVSHYTYNIQATLIEKEKLGKNNNYQIYLNEWLEYHDSVSQDGACQQELASVAELIFDIIDLDNNGNLNRQEWTVLFQSFNIPVVYVNETFDKIDRNHDGSISKEEFLPLLEVRLSLNI